MAESLQRYAVVTGANKGIGLAICKQLASKGVMVVLTARDEKRGLEALEKLKESGLSDHLVFHRLDVTDPASITCLADFVKNRFGKLDILVCGCLNKGIGLAICKQLASKGVMVVLTARDEKRGLEALEKLKESGLSDHLVFHRLDVADPASITCLADFLKNRFGKLDILVNNAGIGGNRVKQDAFKASKISGTEADLTAVWSEVLIETYDVAEECLKTNYYGAKSTADALVPLLQLSDSSRIVNISSFLGKLKCKGALRDADTEEKIDELITEFLKDFKEGSLESKRWPTFLSAYTISKAAMNAYTRILANKYPNFCINCVCPGFVKTDMSYNTGQLTPEEDAAIPVKLALWPNGAAPSGLFFVQGEPSSFE